jgi:hypothetical protein
MGWRAAWTACALALFAVPARAEDTPVRIDYSAPPECPDQREFLARVEQRLERARFAQPDEMARTFRVTVRTKPERSVARVEFVDADGQRASRTIGAETCDEVVNGIALVTALAMDARAGDKTPEPEAPSGVFPAPTPAQFRPPAAPPLALPAGPERGARWDVGAGIDVASAYAPSAAIGLRLFVEHSPSFFSVRASAMHADSGKVDVGGDRARFRYWGGRLEGCPLRLDLGTQLQAVPCAGLDAGALDGEGLPGTGIANPKRATELWLAAVVIARLVLEIDRFLLLEAQADARFPLLRHEFYLESPDRDVHAIPAIGLGGSLGVGFRFE